MEILMVILSVGVIIPTLLAGDVRETEDHPRLHYYTGNIQRPDPYYIFTAPEIVHPGRVARIGGILSNLRTSVLIHIKLVTWHGEAELASDEKFVPIIKSGKPFLLQFMVPNGVENEYAVFVIRMLQHPVREIRKVVRIRKQEPIILVGASKAFYQLGENVELWVLALDQRSMPYKGKIQRATLTEHNGSHPYDVVENFRLKRGLAHLSLSTTNAARTGKHLVKLEIEKYERFIEVDIGRAFSRESSNSINGQPLKHLAEPQKLPQGQLQNLEDRFSSSSGMKIEIMTKKDPFKVGEIVKVDIIYDNPADGLNVFFYEVVCQGEIYINERVIDLYSSWFCRHQMFRLWNTFSEGPTRDDLCKRGQNRFSIHFEAKMDFAPACTFLVYKIIEEKNIVAAKKDIKLQILKPKSKVKVRLSRKSFETNEEFSVVVSDAAESTILFITNLKLIGRESRGTITERNIRNHLGVKESRESDVMQTHCDGVDHVTAAMIFQNSGLSIISDRDPDKPCLEKIISYKRSRFREDEKLTTLEENSTSWIMEKVDILKNRQEVKLITPSRAGTYIIQPVIISSLSCVEVVDSFEIRVKDKKQEPTGFNKVRFLPGRTLPMQPVMVSIEPDVDKKLFIFKYCQPLKMKICLTDSKSILYQMYIVTVDILHNFMLDKDDLKRVHSENKSLIFYVNFPNKTIFYITHFTARRACFSIRLKQTGPLNLSKSRAIFSYLSTANRDNRRFSAYWISQKDCMSSKK